MTVRAAVVLALLAGVLSLGGVRPTLRSAQPSRPPQALRELTRQECITLGLKHSSGVKTALSREAVAQESLRHEKSKYFPRLSFRYYTGWTDSSLFSTEGTPVILQPRRRGFEEQVAPTYFNYFETRLELSLLRDGFLGLGSHKIARAGYSLEQAQFQVGAAKRDLAFQIEAFFLAAQKAQLEKELYQEYVAQNRGLLNLVQEKFAHHLAAKKDVLLADATLGQSQADLAAAEHEYQRALKQLCLVIGLPLDSRVRLSRAPQPLPSLPPFSEVTERIPTQNLDLKARQQDINIARESLALSKKNLWPTVDLLFRYYGSDVQHQSFKDFYAGYLFLRLPLFEYPLYADIRVKRENVSLAANSYQSAVDTALRAAVDQYKELQDIGPQLAALQKRIAYLEENCRDARERYRLDLISFLELHQALLMLHQAKKDQGVLYFKYQGGYRKLLDLMGAEPPPDQPERPGPTAGR